MAIPLLLPGFWRIPAWHIRAVQPVTYNGAALPLAMVGMMTPLLAAPGMSASYLVVLVNALRLSGRKH